MIARLTYRFYSTLAHGSTSTLKIYQTNFPFMFDDEIFLPRPIRQEDFDSDNTIITSANPKNRGNGSYSSQSWTIGLSINGVIVYDGIFFNPPGVSGSFQNAGQLGTITVDTTVQNGLQIGELDTVEIMVRDAGDPYTPWVYYGSIPERAVLAFNQDRYIASMGAINQIVADDNLQLQAVGTRMFVDNFSNAMTQQLTIPFPSAFFLPQFGGGSGVVDAFAMMDFLDGDATIKARSATSFKVIFIEQTFSIGGSEVAPISITRSDANRSINYRQMTYQENTNKIKKLIDNTDFYVFMDSRSWLINFQKDIGDLFLSIFPNFIDLETCKFSFYNFNNLLSLVNENSIPSEISSGIKLIESLDINVNIENVLLNMRPIFLNKIRYYESQNIDRNISVIFLSDLLNTTDDEVSRAKVLLSQYNDDENLSKIKFDFGFIQTPNLTDANVERSTSIITDVFNTVSEKFIYSDGARQNVFQFVSLLSTASGTSFIENNVIIKEDGINANTIRENLAMMTSDDFVGIASTDYDGDNKITLIDRIYEVLNNFDARTLSSINPNYSYVGNTPLSEVQLWRKICSIGQLFKFRGTVSQAPTPLGNGNYKFQIDLQWPEDSEQEAPENNKIWVYVEYGATSNLSGWPTDSDEPIEIKGRLFFPGYFIGTKMNNVMKFNDRNEIPSWYRIYYNTADDLIFFGINNETKNEPIIVVRSNMTPSSQEEADTNNTSIPAIFDGVQPGNQGPIQYFKISQITEEIGDYINNPSSPEIEEDPFSLQVNGPPRTIFTGPNNRNISIYNIEFDVAIESIEDERFGDFEFEVTYKPENFENFVQIGKFWSAISRESTSGIKKYRLKPHQKQRFLCKQPPNIADHKTFDICFPYKEKSDGSNYVFTWNSSDWQYKIIKNNSVISSFESPPNSETGRFVLLSEINENTDVIYAEFNNIGGNQKSLKIGNQINLKCFSGPSDVSPPVISNIRINFSEETSIERVEGSYSATQSQGGPNYHQIAPSYAFLSHSGNEWSFTPFEYLSSSSGSTNNFRILGNLESPILYFDAFTNDTSYKTVKKIGNNGFPTIDIVYSNLTNSSGLPFVEVFGIEYIAPPPGIIPQITSIRNSINNKLVVIYNKEYNLYNKMSNTDFREFYSTDKLSSYTGETERYYYPIYTMVTSEVPLQFESNSSGEYVIKNVSQTGKEFIGATFYFNRERNANTVPAKFSAKFGSSSVSSFGYENSEGQKFSQICPTNNVSTINFPPSIGLSEITISPVTVDSNGDGVGDKTVSLGSLISVIGRYADRYISGSSPTLSQSKNGEFILFYSNKVSNLNQIFAIMSKNEGTSWMRPSGKYKINDPLIGSPIAILSGFSNPIILRNRNLEDVFYLFAYDSTDQSIMMVIFNRNLILGLREGQGEETDLENLENNSDDRGIDKKTYDRSVKSWTRVLNSGNVRNKVFSDSTGNFAADLDQYGNLYLGSISIDGEMRIKFSKKLNLNEIGQGIVWEDFGINLFDENSKLFQSLRNINVKAIKFMYDDLKEILNIFFADIDNLILLQLPITYIYDPNFQDDFNEILPTLIIGQSDNFDSNTIITSTASNESFPPQIIATEMNKQGVYFIYYINKNGLVQSKLSIDNGTNWLNHKFV